MHVANSASPFLQYGLNDPSQVQSPVMEDAKKDIRGNARRGVIEHGKEVAGGRLNEFLSDDALHRLAPDELLPSGFRGAFMCVLHCVRHDTPRALAKVRIVGLEIHLRHFQIENWLDGSLVLGDNQAARFSLILGLHALAMPGLIFLSVEHSVRTPVKTELVLHFADFQLRRNSRKSRSPHGNE
jgi:hypothetical protein